ncbi:cellulose synthase/poly-beta-1,6-N-acetylglucosamine synthase-like glycosyltransferase [Gelidibacter sediminis]|uniref:Cellulose synthase/poly-beta-1,6-N-acetylglucosamine synthase-like glycosyltransferase n=2 Tax=Gelidibacter sediminis TaxID=1608710 RepID=A0A4V3F9B7_9FLAO|nr:cellulose synthase/poly-beta-1,6-N-acetylglucosamine synthase-like glycosyltransferase [Gelidibacter sediminis]
MLKAPTRLEKFKIRILIVFGLASLVNFFYWFFEFELIDNQVLYWMLMMLICFDTFRLIYIWYHYWNLSVPHKPTSHNHLTVDVFTTYFPGEPKHMLKDTLLAIQQMDYPHTTYLCDEANDIELIEFCRLHQIIHVTRDNRKDAKAGNINNALRQAKGEICLILDPDHIPHNNFLKEIIPYFNDPEIGFVQTVQSYYNLNESLVARAAAEQTFHFYGPVMMCMNSYGTVNAIGANCIFRRSALDSIGGHAAGLSEDMHTAMKLHAKGWKSIYVPKALSEGLAPATLTSYFKQQLKWSRGTLELLVSTFPKLINKLSWRQKLHYGILPLHYLTGFIFLFSILIPIIALFTSTTPWKGNVINYGLILLPVLVSILGIRFYVQKWVINKGERGMHLLGGLLMQITWSIYLMGMFYTIIRKKVPYLPTVKEDDQKTDVLIVLPNIIVGLISILAIIYGLYRDLTPFSIFMSGFALWNAMIMFYTLHFAYQFNRTSIPDRKKLDANFNNESKFEKIIFNIWQKSALVITGFILISAGYFNYKQEQTKLEGMAYEPELDQTTTYVGVFAPKIDNGLSDFSLVSEFSQSIGQEVSIISFYLAWDKSLANTFPEQELLQVYEEKAFPMITWEPWINSFTSGKSLQGHVVDSIYSGYFDEFIADFAVRLKNLQKPVFLRFAHEFDNPFYPWYDHRDDAADKFKKSWIHIWNIFEEQGADNVVWIYNPWKPENVMHYFPGHRYVDWLSVNLLNYATYDQPDLYNSFESLYEPYHNEFEKLGTYPIMLSEFGTYFDPDFQKQWLENAMLQIDTNYNEIRAIVYFNSNVDNNMPDGTEGDSYLNWTIADINNIDLSFKSENIPPYLFKNTPKIDTAPLRLTNQFKKLENTRGVNLKNSQGWNRDYHVLTRKNLESHFRMIKDLGLNTINYTSNDTYDYNVVNITKEFGLNLSFGFWIPDHINFYEDLSASILYKDKIVHLVEKHKSEEHIKAWRLQNNLMTKYNSSFDEPVRSYHRRAYVLWLQQLTSEIKKIDPSRPIIIDYKLNNLESSEANDFLRALVNVDGLGIIVNEGLNTDIILKAVQSLEGPHIFTDISVEMLGELEKASLSKGFFVKNWQDQHQIDKLSFDGLIDRKGRLKPDYQNLKTILDSKEDYNMTNGVGILKTIDLLKPGQQAYFYAMLYDPLKGWERVESEDYYEIEWALVKCDLYGNYQTIKDVGDKGTLLLTIPENYEDYRIQLSIIKDKKVMSKITTLNTPYIP